MKESLETSFAIANACIPSGVIIIYLISISNANHSEIFLILLFLSILNMAIPNFFVDIIASDPFLGKNEAVRKVSFILRIDCCS